MSILTFKCIYSILFLGGLISCGDAFLRPGSKTTVSSFEASPSLKIVQIFEPSFRIYNMHSTSRYLLKSNNLNFSRHQVWRWNSRLFLDKSKSTNSERALIIPSEFNGHTYPLDADSAANLINDVIFPSDQTGQRSIVGREAQGVGAGMKIEADDPRLALTYGEFPLESFDSLVDASLSYVSPRGQPMKLIDLGSGCGRLVLYAALTRCSPTTDSRKCDSSMDVHGIEISPLLHEYAIETLQNCLEKGFFSPCKCDDTDNLLVRNGLSSILQLHLGDVEECKNVLRDADIIFSYSTVFPTSGFSPECGAMLMTREFSQMLSQSCPLGCIVITTDRILDPKYGWKLLEKIDVENTALFGSTGYIQKLDDTSCVAT